MTNNNSTWLEDFEEWQKTLPVSARPLIEPMKEWIGKGIEQAREEGVVGGGLITTKKEARIYKDGFENGLKKAIDGRRKMTNNNCDHEYQPELLEGSALMVCRKCKKIMCDSHQWLIYQWDTSKISQERVTKYICGKCKKIWEVE